MSPWRRGRFSWSPGSRAASPRFSPPGTPVKRGPRLTVKRADHAARSDYQRSLCAERAGSHASRADLGRRSIRFGGESAEADAAEVSAEFEGLEDVAPDSGREEFGDDGSADGG